MASRNRSKKCAEAKGGSPSQAAATPADAALLAKKVAATEAAAAALPHNEIKEGEYGDGPPPAGVPAEAAPIGTASTVREDHESAKLGEGAARPGRNAAAAPLDAARADSSGRRLTTDQGVPIADDQSSLKLGLRGPTLLEDFVLREKLTHFDHERIPERVVHARGSGAHGFFECYEPLRELTRASLFAEAGKRTPVFVRFSTVAGERGSADTVRDVRGFAVKFYTDEGNWDLVGNNIPVFFIQDAMKFPDLVHALKPEPHHAMPQASSAHDTFWDFVSMMPESAHMLLWAMSDRAIPRSYRTMQGFGVHTYRLVDEAGRSRFVKFHWSPRAGTHSLDWDEAVKIAGAQPDFHRRDLWEAIEAGAYPEYELGFQVFDEEQADAFSFDVLDPTKIVPEELVPVRPVGRLVLDRNPDNFFAETEQVAFCVANLVPGIDFSDDPLLAGRIHSYLDTQLLRLGGPNFHELPINAPVVEVHNHHRDGFHRRTIARGRVAYEPNSLAGGSPSQAGPAGFQSYREPVAAVKLRGKPESFADHFTQATLFWNSQTPVEQAHIVAAFRFELTRVETRAVRERVVSLLANVADELAARVAEGLGMEKPPAQPRVLRKPPTPEVEESPALSLFARPGSEGIRTRRVAILAEPWVDGAAAAAARDALAAQGAAASFVATRLGVAQAARQPLEVEVSIEAAPSVLWDALVLPGAPGELPPLPGPLLEFVQDQYRHCKPILVLGAAAAVLEAAGVPLELPSGDPDPGLLAFEDGAVEPALAAFVDAIARHRHFERQADPPPV